MPVTLNFEVDTRSVTRLFRELPTALVRRHMRRTMEKAANPLAKSIRSEIRAINTPDSTGVLGKSIRAIAKTGKTNLITSVRVGAIREAVKLVPLKRDLKSQGTRSYVRLRKRKASRYFHLSGKNRDGAERVKRLFYSYRQQLATDIAIGLEQALITEVSRLRAKQ